MECWKWAWMVVKKLHRKAFHNNSKRTSLTIILQWDYATCWTALNRVLPNYRERRRYSSSSRQAVSHRFLVSKNKIILFFLLSFANFEKNTPPYCLFHNMKVSENSYLLCAFWIFWLRAKCVWCGVQFLKSLI